MIIFQCRFLRNGLLAATILAGPVMMTAPSPASAQISVGLSVRIAPPVLPIYSQPPIPAYGYIWTPGFWAWSPAVGYYWVPGTWVRPPAVGVLWTPPYWGWVNGVYLFHEGYWGPHVGFYGGVNYGFGYGGRGFEGGRWENGGFAYNQAVTNFGSVHVTNIYRQNVTTENNTRVSFAGGAGGIQAEPTAQDQLAEHDHHVAMTTEQTRHFTAAAANPALAARTNHGRPAIAATARPGQFSGAGVVHSRPAVAHATVQAHAAVHQGPHPAAHPARAQHPAAAPQAQRPAHGHEEPDREHKPEP
jgi:hypothetical protein